MLFLDRIEILGFKSFCEKTILKFPTGITSIVGPNGCGKSNVVDAMNWVLGEQSAKSLRSDKMEEVIFNGSKNRKPLNLAQVTLIWKTEKDSPSAPEITIARRLFRNGESQYEMNGDICRLKDIHSFFLNEGFDPLAYSILEQGRIAFLIDSKPLERRGLIEEVAGVAEFKTKKRQAQMKLADNQLQLERIQDILAEVEKQLSSLKRQAAKARRFQILKEEKGIVQRILFHRRYTQVELEHHRTLELLEQRMAEEEHAHQALQQLELGNSETKLRFTELESQLYHDQSQLHQLQMEIQENQNAFQSRKQRIEELKRNIEDKQLEIQRLTEEEVRLTENSETRAREESELRMQIDDLIRQHTELFGQLEQASAEVTSLEQKAQQIQKQILECLHNASHLKNEQTRLHTQHDHLADTMQRKESELATAKQAQSQFSETLQNKKQLFEQYSQEIGYLDQTRTDILQKCEQSKVEWDRLQERVQTAFRRQGELQRELQKLDAQQHSSKFYNESARNLLNAPSRSAIGMMMDFIETEPQFETAVENFLADKLNYLIVNEEQSALASIDYLKQQGIGYCAFVIKNGHDTNPPVLPEFLRLEEGVLGSLREMVRIKEEALPAVAPFMQSAVLVSDLQCAQGLIKKYPEYQFVTVQGDVILSPAVYAGGAKTEDVPGLIAIQRQRKEHEQQLEIVEHQLHSLEEMVRALQENLEISNREMVRLIEVRESKNKDRQFVQIEMDQTERELRREEKVIEILMEEMTRLINEKEAVEARSEQFAQQWQQEVARKEECDRTIEETEQQLKTRKQEQGELHARVQEMRIRTAELNERDRALLAEIDRLNQQRTVVRTTIEENGRVIEQRSMEGSQLEEACLRLESERTGLLRSQDEQKAIIEEREKQKAALSEQLTIQENDLQNARAALDQIRQDRNHTEVEKARVETQREDLIVRCRDEMGIELNTLTLPESDWNQLDEENLRNKLIEIETKIERLGSINMLALEEYTQMEERHRFLKTQYEDLKLSIATLLETIQRIDQTSLQRFREAYEGVQQRFLDLFQKLFNGGKAEMILIDPENQAESGIDIHVQPPGKRLQNMHQLSGGEKALTGVAFLMAMFQYHASPFCVMDEVDAPLDEVNVQRFAQLISEMKKQVQFIIVTHNKRTMEAADQLYGVTMAEPGVSTVLSAKFEDAEALIET